MPSPKLRDPNAVDGILSLVLVGAGIGVTFGLGWGLTAAGGLMFLSVFADDLRRNRGA